DRPGLLAVITAALAASRLEVHAAQIHTRAVAGAEVEAVDLFWVRDRGEGVSGVERALPKLERDLAAMLAGEASPIELARRRGKGQRTERSIPKVKIQVSVDDRASPRHTVIEVVARDRPGLLFEISEAMHDLRLSI
ncbi:MAG: [protein-PII] uridylyltransferase, partial [Byssovorax sp.]